MKNGTAEQISVPESGNNIKAIDTERVMLRKSSLYFFALQLVIMMVALVGCSGITTIIGTGSAVGNAALFRRIASIETHDSTVTSVSRGRVVSTAESTQGQEVRYPQVHGELLVAERHLAARSSKY